MSAPTNSLAGKVAVITGASKGNQMLWPPPFQASFSRVRQASAAPQPCASSAKEADELVQHIGSDRALAVKADAGSLPDLERLASATVEKFARIDILIPNAAVLQMCDLAGTSEEQFDKAMQLNVNGPYFLCQKAAPHMAAGSHVVLISTSVCHFSSIPPNYLLYATTKGAIEQMTRVMAKNLGRKGIFVNAVAPGPTGTELFFQGKSEQLLNTIRGWAPFNRIGEPDEIAEVIAFVSGSRWVNGQVFKANGGMA